MASPEAVAEAIKFLAGADPKAFIREGTPTAFAEILSDVSDGDLRAAYKHLASQPDFQFPTAGRLRQAALVAREGMRPDPSWLPLRAREVELHDRVWLEGVFEPAEWEKLAQEFERIDHPYGAGAVRAKAAGIAAVREGAKEGR